MRNKMNLIYLFVLFTLWDQATTETVSLDILNINLNIWNKDNSEIELNLIANPNSAAENNPTIESNSKVENKYFQSDNVTFGLENKYYGSYYLYYSGSGSGEGTGNCKCGVKKGVSRSPNVPERIIHGEFVTPHEYPWMVPAIDTKTSGLPGYTGSIISSKTILVCGHCIPGNEVPPDQIKEALEWTGFWAGSHNFTTDEQGVQKMKAERFVKMDPNIVDLGLIILKDSLTWSENVKPVCLPNSGNYDNIPVIGLGYGDQGYGSGVSTVPKEIGLTTTSKLCNTEKEICLVSKNNSSGLGGGDSGGPLIVLEAGGYYNQIGVLTATFPGYNMHFSTRVTTFLKWIKDNMVGETCPPP